MKYTRIPTPGVLPALATFTLAPVPPIGSDEKAIVVAPNNTGVIELEQTKDGGVILTNTKNASVTYVLFIVERDAHVTGTFLYGLARDFIAGRKRKNEAF